MTMKEYQVTLMCTTGKYKPVSCIIKKDAEELRTIGQSEFKADLRKRGLLKICQTRGWSSKDLERYGYTRIIMREYDKEKIEKENKERYEKIKKERGWS